MWRSPYFLLLFSGAAMAIGIACSTAKVGVKSPFDPLIGKWAGTLGEGKYYENWQKISNAHLQGEAFWIRGRDTALVEDLRIQKMGNYWTYVAMINESRPVLFTLVKEEPRQWIFENSEHDYPRIVGYRLISPDSLSAWTEGEINGNFRKNEYKLGRQGK